MKNVKVASFSTDLNFDRSEKPGTYSRGRVGGPEIAIFTIPTVQIRRTSKYIACQIIGQINAQAISTDVSGGGGVGKEAFKESIEVAKESVAAAARETVNAVNAAQTAIQKDMQSRFSTLAAYLNDVNGRILGNLQ